MGGEWIIGGGLGLLLLFAGAAWSGWYVRGREASKGEQLWEERHDQILAQLADLLEDREAGHRAAQAVIESERRVLAARSSGSRRERRRLLLGGDPTPAGPPTAPGPAPAEPGSGDPAA